MASTKGKGKSKRGLRKEVKRRGELRKSRRGG